MPSFCFFILAALSASAGRSGPRALCTRPALRALPAHRTCPGRPLEPLPAHRTLWAARRTAPPAPPPPRHTIPAGAAVPRAGRGLFLWARPLLPCSRPVSPHPGPVWPRLISGPPCLNFSRASFPGSFFAEVLPCSTVFFPFKIPPPSWASTSAPPQPSWFWWSRAA